MRKHEFIKSIFESDDLAEVKMSPSSLTKWLSSPEADGMLAGIEFEMAVPDVGSLDDGDSEPDYDADTRVHSTDDIIEFFESEMGRNEARQARERIENSYLEWFFDQQNEYMDNNNSERTSRIWDRLEEEYDFDDALERASEELGDEVPDSDVEDRAREIKNEDINEMISNEGRDWQRAWDDVTEEMEEEFRSDGPSESDWLDDIGITWASDAEREWGFLWPHYRPVEGEADLASVAREFSDALGLDDKINYSSSYHGVRRDGVNWIIEPDSSIETNDRDDAGLEFISPPLPLKDAVAAIKKVYAWAKRNKCYTNDSTGLHMNISVPDLTIEKLDYVKLALFMGDQYILEQFGRSFNSYAKSAMELVKTRAKDTEVAETVLSKMKAQLNSSAGKLIHNGITQKFTSINTKDKYVEFRGPGGDYLSKDPEELINTAIRLAMSLRIATDPEAYKQEYAKKLYQLIDRSAYPNKGQLDSVELFAKFRAGLMSKRDLIISLQMAKEKRMAKKSPSTNTLQIENLPDMWRSIIRSLREWDDDQLITYQYLAYDSRQLVPNEKEFVLGVLQREIDRRRSQSPNHPGEFTGYWLVVDSTNNVLYRFSGVGNSSADANRVARQWIDTQPNPDDLRAQVRVVPEMQPSGAAS